MSYYACNKIIDIFLTRIGTCSENQLLSILCRINITKKIYFHDKCQRCSELKIGYPFNYFYIPFYCMWLGLTYQFCSIFIEYFIYDNDTLYTSNLDMYFYRRTNLLLTKYYLNKPRRYNPEYFYLIALLSLIENNAKFTKLYMNGLLEFYKQRKKYLFNDDFMARLYTDAISGLGKYKCGDEKILIRLYADLYLDTKIISLVNKSNIDNIYSNNEVLNCVVLRNDWRMIYSVMESSSNLKITTWNNTKITNETRIFIKKYKQFRSLLTSHYYLSLVPRDIINEIKKYLFEILLASR